MKNINIIHLAGDDKFISYAFDQFNEIIEFNNTFEIFDKEIDGKYRFVNFESNSNDFNNINHSSFIDKLNTKDLIVIHYLNSNYLTLLQNTNLKTPILWIGWGGDYYYLIDTLSSFNMFKERTSDLLGEPKNPIVKFFISNVKKYRRRKIMNILNRINYFAPVIKEDYDLIRQNYPNFKADYVNWNYSAMEILIEGLEDFIVNDNNILIGNSATPSNNHLDVLHTLKNIEFNSSILLPLSYGDSTYANSVEAAAVRLFDNQVNVIRDFIPYKEYIDLIKSCGNVIMGHTRQQAFGNILVMLHFGAKIFFFEDSIALKYFKRHNLKVFTIEELVLNNKLLNYNFNQSEIELQRLNLYKIWGSDINKQKTRNIYRLVEG